jgi:hypothetical protein
MIHNMCYPTTNYTSSVIKLEQELDNQKVIDILNQIQSKKINDHRR